MATTPSYTWHFLIMGLIYTIRYAVLGLCALIGPYLCSLCRMSCVLHMLHVPALAVELRKQKRHRSSWKRWLMSMNILLATFAELTFGRLNLLYSFELVIMSSGCLLNWGCSALLVFWENLVLHAVEAYVVSHVIEVYRMPSNRIHCSRTRGQVQESGSESKRLWFRSSLFVITV